MSEEQMKNSIPADITQGVPNVAAKKEAPKGGVNMFYVGCAAFILGLFAFVWYTNSGKDSAEKEPKKEQNSRITSNRKLTVVPLPQEERTPNPAANENKRIVEEQPHAFFSAPEPIPPASLTAAQPAAVSVEPIPASVGEPKEPTLAERRFAAPMMGKDSDLQSEKSVEVKGLSERLREEGFDAGTPGKLGSLLHSTSTPSSRAALMPDRNLLLAKGTFIDCILETKLDTTVPGMTSCVIPRDVYSANGKVLLLERGSKAIGEYTGAVENGLNRIFVLWTQIQTPKGIRIRLDSPGADALGGSGLPGHIDYHWWARFGNALLFTLVQDAFDFGMTKQTENNGGVNYYQNSEDGMKEIIREAMRQSGNIPPTLTKNQGERIGIFVARDVDFSTVYRIRPKQ